LAVPTPGAARSAQAEFYRDVLGLQVVPVDASALGATAFLSSRPAEVPVDLALFANPAYQHTAFNAVRAERGVLSGWRS
jgi:hypothetical protein